MAKTSDKFKAAHAKVEEALALLDTDTADGIIGDPQPDEYGKLARGVRGVHQMLWIMAVSNGLRQTAAVRKMGSQAELFLLTLVHYAYALGIQRGREE